MSLVINSVSNFIKTSRVLKPFKVDLGIHRNRGAYDGISQTHATIINQNPGEEGPKMIKAVSKVSFRLNDNALIFGPMIIYKRDVFCWNIRGDDEINEASMEFMFHLNPPVDLIVIGYGNHENKNIFKQNIHLTCRKNNVAVEVLYVDKALSTYNFSANMRNVLGAFVPPVAILGTNDFEIVQQNMRDMIDVDQVPLYSEELFEGTLPGIPKYARKKLKKDEEKKLLKE